MLSVDILSTYGNEENFQYKFELETGKVGLISGKSGSGKTTLFECIIGSNKCKGDKL